MSDPIFSRFSPCIAPAILAAMKPPADPAPLAQLLAQALQLDPAAIDALYGLEPVYEPEAGDGHAELCTDV